MMQVHIEDPTGAPSNVKITVDGKDITSCVRGYTVKNRVNGLTMVELEAFSSLMAEFPAEKLNVMLVNGNCQTCAQWERPHTQSQKTRLCDFLETQTSPVFGCNQWRRVV
jgi:hypothetical protein